MNIKVGDLVIRKETPSRRDHCDEATGLVMDIQPMGCFGEWLYEILWPDGSFQKLTSKGIERIT